ncbi:MAG TPA: TonB-dependent receptor, partial [Flavisolibacter sp.]|nr:TonB-dependent receptor [Flavisolibacter sp.]
VTGSVTDAETKTALELATVSVFRQDSSLVSYRLSDKNGKFTFDKLPLKTKLLVSVTYSGYVGYHTSVQLDTERPDTLAVFLALSLNDTNAIVITTTVPIRMNGDTLEINPAAFKMKNDAVVEELLNQVSGITIWSDGTITVNGKKVQNLLVDGKPFLGSTDPRIATQNLPKTAIEKIQLYQEYDRSNIGREGQPQDSLLTMNIKLKEASKKGYFGKAGAGYGTTNRFESDLSFQVYNKKSSAGIGGGFNNINKNIGNLQEIFQNNTYRNFNPNLYSVGNFGGNGINKNHSVGGVFTHNFIETANSRQNNRIVFNYNTAGTDAYLTDLNLQNRTTINNPQIIRDEGTQNNRNNRHNLGINYVKTNSYNDNLNVNGTLTTSTDRGRSARFTEVRDSAARLQSTNSSTTFQTRQSDNESLSVNFTKSDRDDLLKSFSFQANGRRSNSRSERDVRTVFESLTDRSKNAFFNRRYAANNNNINLSGTLNYLGFKRMLLGRYNLFGIQLGFSQWFNYMQASDDSRVSDYDSSAKRYIANSKISNQNKREILEYIPSITLSKSISKWSDAYSQYMDVQVKFLEDIKTDKNESSFAKRNMNRSFQFFRYEGNISFQRSKRDKYQYYMSVNYAKNFEYPSIDQLYTIVDDINAYDIRVGNPQLRNRINHRLNLNTNFNTQKPNAVYSINGNIGGSYNRSINPVADSIINDPSGKRISYFTNADKSDNLNLNYNFNISRKLNRNNFQLQYNGQLSTGKLPNYIDGTYNISETDNLSNGVTLQLSIGSTLIVNVAKTLQHYKTRQSAAGLTSFKNSSNSTKLGMVLNYPANFTFSSTADLISNSNLDKPTVLWNGFATYRFMKQQGELKFAAMDILKQYKNITNSVNAYGTTTRITNGLQQFFLLTFSYFPRKFGKTEIKKQRG